MDSGSRGDINNPAKREPGAGTGEPGVAACTVTGTLYVHFMYFFGMYKKVLTFNQQGSGVDERLSLQLYVNF